MINAYTHVCLHAGPVADGREVRLRHHRRGPPGIEADVPPNRCLTCRVTSCRAVVRCTVLHGLDILHVHLCTWRSRVHKCSRERERERDADHVRVTHVQARTWACIRSGGFALTSGCLPFRSDSRPLCMRDSPPRRRQIASYHEPPTKLATRDRGPLRRRGDETCFGVMRARKDACLSLAPGAETRQSPRPRSRALPSWGLAPRRR